MNDQKIDNLLNLALEATQREREDSLVLDVGYVPEEQVWDLIVRYTGDIRALEEESISITPLTGGYAIVTLPESRIQELSGRPEIEYIEKPKRLFFAVNQGKAASCVSAVQTEKTALFGKGILVAVIDSGIDFRHPDFRDGDGNTRIEPLWDQTVAGSPPVGYRIGTEFSREDLNRLLRGERLESGLEPSADFSGHGTQVAGIAAGNGQASGGVYRGMAPLCSLLAVKLGVPRENGFPRTTELMQAVDYAVKKGISLGMPVAVNLSFGNVYGSHDGTSLVATFLSGIAGTGKSVICIGTGNEGSAGRHASGILREGQTANTELAVAEYEPSLNIQIWKEYVDEFDIELIHPNGESIGPLRERLGAQRFAAGKTEILAYYGEPGPYSTAQEIFLDFLPAVDYIDSGRWTVRLTPKRIVDGRFDIWLPGTGTAGTGTRFYGPDPETTLTIPSTAGKIIAVGAYDSRRMTYAPFSGRGFTRNGQVKPDLAAPGVEIVTTTPGGGYGPATGTSFATPFVTGAAAMLMQWGITEGNDPYLYGEKIRAYLIRGARHLSAERTYPNERLGWGVLCVKDSLPA